MFSCLASAVILAQISGAASSSEDGAPPGMSPVQAAPTAAVAASPPTDWYGLPALVTDGAALTLMASGLAARNTGLFLLGGAGYLIGAPVNHIINGRPGRAVGSVFLRQFAAAMAVGIIFVSYTSQGCDSDGAVSRDDCELGVGMAAGAVLLAGAAILDDLRIAHPAPEPTARKRSSLTPGLVITPNLGFASLGGAF
jgi:hypothetical protein